MKEFFDGMTGLDQSFWIFALIGSAVFIVIFALSLFGGDVDMEADMDISEGGDDGGVGFQFFTFKNTVAFFTIFGWTGTICVDHELSSTLSIAIATGAGLLMMVLTSLLFFWVSSMSHSGTLKIKNAVGVVGEVYLPIGAKQSSIGKIQIKVQGSLRELDAITNADETLSTNTIIKVTEVVSDELLLVEKLTKQS